MDCTAALPADGYFNPHSHAGSDMGDAIYNQAVKISIHTPTQGVTAFKRYTPERMIDFNPHSHAGSDIPDLGI